MAGNSRDSEEGDGGGNGGGQILWIDPATGPGDSGWAIVRLGFCKQPDVAYIGYGKPDEGETPEVFGKEYIRLIVTTAAGAPIKNDDGENKKIKVLRNATGTGLYTQFDSETIFTYVKFPNVESEEAIGGCIFSRTEAYRSDAKWIPDDGVPIHNENLPEPQSPPPAEDITGNAGDENHLYVRGLMYLKEADDGYGRGWVTWSVIDPDKLGLYKVKINKDDKEAGYLDAKITVDDEWLQKTMRGGNVGREIYLEHIGPSDVDASEDAIADVVFVEDEETKERILTITSNVFEYDEKGHFTGLGQTVDREINISAADDRFVAANDADENPGTLDDKLIVDETWLKKTIENEQVKIEHIGPDPEGGGLSIDVGGVAIGTAASNGGIITFPTYSVNFDTTGHVLVTGLGPAEPVLQLYSGDAWNVITTDFSQTGRFSFTWTHADPQAAAQTITFVSGVSIGTSFGGWGMSVTTTGIAYDLKGHVVGYVPGSTYTTPLVSVSVVTDARVYQTYIQVKRRKIYVLAADPEGEWETIHTGDTCQTT